MSWIHAHADFLHGVLCVSQYFCVLSWVLYGGYALVWKLTVLVHGTYSI